MRTRFCQVHKCNQFYTLFSSLILLPFAICSGWGGWDVQRFILLKSCIVLASWLAGYFAMKHLPLTIVGPVNATRPVLVLIGAMLIFGERLNTCQCAYRYEGRFWLHRRSLGHKPGRDNHHRSNDIHLYFHSTPDLPSDLQGSKRNLVR